ncbi:lysine N(6)-hydroxylase/L-ornithine N(5)-oxygenase family protein [Nocardia brasiliensis]|uniref:L-lysine N6-monooxygenase MbtG n=1 Tax=Nocardia brasiliensis (strain ATCC 700358 / HUJEG-1) TaxID=1133849 RepID=K0FAR2_NOCB7|nr:SidA/IucD/PvdA family monooxygenase [Nocardia brasiliensis]AFU04551.1 L-lysine 6-monooxygenase [Nocardia brasiliensis ATCC 700358]OCF85776.1 L-lysine 6-monooxygenase [Nocardia brasiliensis]
MTGSTGDEIVDIAGIGFGPSNLALAIALEEHNQDRSHERLSARFVETKARFEWHPGMLLPGATMQISFLKDLVTQRNVRSRYSFLNYLKEHDRLTDFINLSTFRPTRLEFQDYLRWAARTVDAEVSFGTTAVSVAAAGDYFEIQLDGAAPGVLRARNIVVAVGLSARLPEGVAPSARVFHSHRLLPSLETLPRLRHNRFVVLGAGQSAAEVVGHLHQRYEDARVHAVFGKYGLSPADDSPYANRIFDPAAVDDFYASSPELRRQLMTYHRGTNYSAVEPSLIERLYAQEYAERVAGDRRLFMHGASTVASIEDSGSGVRVDVTHGPTGLTETLMCDAVVCATGFRPGDVRTVLGELAESVAFESGQVQVTRDYRLVPTAPLPGDIYLQGGTEHTHGLSSSLLSNIAVRTGEIVRSVARAATGARADRAADRAGR